MTRQVHFSLALILAAPMAFAQAPIAPAPVASATAAPPSGVSAPVAPAAADHKPRLLTEYAIEGLQKKLPSFQTIDEAMDIVDLVKFLAQQAELNVIFGREVTGASKLMLKDVTIGDALESVLAANGLAYELRGGILKIMTDKEYRDQYGEGFYERKQAKVIQLKYAFPAKVVPMLQPILSATGKIVPDDATGSLILIDTPEKIREMEAIILKAEIPTIQRIQPTVTTNFVLQYAKVEDIEPQIKTYLTQGMGELRTDKRTKTLILTDVPSVIAKIGDLVALFDREQKQVFIEAKIIQIKLSDEFRMGVKWDYLFQGINPRFSINPVSQFPLGLDEVKDSFGKLTFHTIAAGGDLNAVVQALTTIGDTKILSNPHIAVLDGEEATIKVVEEQPYAELTYESGSTNVTGKTYKFIPVGVTLAVTPRINELGFISVAIKPEVSTITGIYDASGGQGVPIVKRSFAETSVTVRDGVTIIIAGMIDEEKIKQISRVPLLGWIPVLGMLFRWEDTTTVSAETVVLLTPRIVTGSKFVDRLRDIKKAKAGGKTTSSGAFPDMP